MPQKVASVRTLEGNVQIPAGTLYIVVPNIVAHPETNEPIPGSALYTFAGSFPMSPGSVSTKLHELMQQLGDGRPALVEEFTEAALAGLPPMPEKRRG